MIRKDHVFLISKRKNNHKKIVGRLWRQYPAYEHISKAVPIGTDHKMEGKDIKTNNSFNSYIPEYRYNPNFPLLFKRTTSFSIYWAGNLLAQPEECSFKYLRSTCQRLRSILIFTTSFRLQLKFNDFSLSHFLWD